MAEQYTSKTLYRKGKKGETLVWRTWAKDGFIYTEHGQEGGQLQVSEKEVYPKNIGKANETTKEEQAVKESQALYKNKLTRKYRETKEEADAGVFLPMLAKKYDEKKVNFPCYLQPKLDGVRCMAYWEGDRIILLSRSGREYDQVPHINKQLSEFLPKDKVIDGEIYTHGYTFQEITRLVKKNRPESVNLEYHVYDLVDKDTSIRERWVGRWMDLSGLKIPESCSHVKKVYTIEINANFSIPLIHAKFLNDGYEGTIIRNIDGLYTFGHRCNDLFKVKTTEDSEFEIIGFREGEGRLKGTVIWECKNDVNGQTFDVTPKGSLELREEYFKNGNDYIGEFLKVSFIGRTEDQKPKCAVGEGIRLKADMS